MQPGALIAEWFPHVKWTGGSALHRSYCKQTALPPRDPIELMHVFKKSKVGEGIYKLLTTKFSALSWQINEEEFATLFYADCYRHMVGKPDTKTDHKLVNPQTQNTFHRVALAESIVGGVRFWCDRQESSKGKFIHFGFRFRLECVEGETAASVRAQVVDSYDDAATVEIAEPVNEPAVPVPVGEWLQ